MITIHRRFSRLQLHVQPLPGGISDESGARQVARGLLHLVASIAGKQLQNFAGIFSILLADLGGVVLFRRFRFAQEPVIALLIGVPSRQQRYMRLFSGSIDGGRIFIVEIPIYIRPEAGAFVF